MKNVQLIITITMYWNNDPEHRLTKEAYVGVYNEDESDIDTFYWFDTPADIISDHGDFTVLDYKVLNTNNNMLLTKLEEYDDYMTTKVESEGYELPISLKQFLDMQVNPIAISNLNFKNKRDIRLFERVRDLYLEHSVEVMDATELSNTPVCYAEWLQCEGLGAES